MASSELREHPAYREAVLQRGRLGLGSVGHGGCEAAGQGRLALGLDGIDGGARADALLQVECEPP